MKQRNEDLTIKFTIFLCIIPIIFFSIYIYKVMSVLIYKIKTVENDNTHINLNEILYKNEVVTIYDLIEQQKIEQNANNSTT